ncbi:putative cytochrome P450 [Talaromyces proteolyticus]|uniref:Cytochrome P450 n=1 Tax=Talaromyces proteolyticus TaxID=1131652 RepID=A0AAD4KCS7_9EURO|nr:putative cytochrome P450 [Talaromyces proteolyticus]KAH8688748.1 putative cytochrome P450 [Talaromyces proteolyticus]
MAPVSILPDLDGSLGIALLCFVLLTVLYTINVLFFRVASPKGVPLIREPPGNTSFSFKTRLAYFTDCKSLYREAYENYSKKGKVVIIPGFGVRQEIILPTSSLGWALKQPETVLSVGDAFAEVDQAHYSLGHSKYVTDAWQGHLVKTELNHVLENIVAALNDELGIAFSAYFGTDEDEWKVIDLLETIRMVVAQAASRFTVGLPLCRDVQYIRDCFDAIDGCIINAGVTGGTPPMLRPLVGPIAGLKTQLAQRKVRKHFEPIYRARLETLKYAKDDPQHVEPQDHLQMMIRFAQKERPDELYDLDVMARRLTSANFGSMHQTSIQASNMLLNILGSDTEYNTIAILRDEVNQVMGTDTEWTKAKVSKMIKADSVARETLRCHSFGGRAVFRKVLTHGVETDTGIKLPKGSLISFLSQPVHTDEDMYEEALKYDPFRFSRIRESDPDSTKINTLSFVSTSPNYLSFGHGKHACPGRFLIDFELKMIIAYVLMNYDIKFPEEYGGKRPENRWLTEAIMPPDGVKVSIKRRKATTS